MSGNAAILAASPVRIHPRFRQLPPPVIVVGPHRSGTSVTAGMLAELGVFMGAQSWPSLAGGTGTDAASQRLAELHEALEFFLLNERLLRRAGAAWNHIEPFLAVRDEPAFARRSLGLLQRATHGSLRTGYLGPLPATFNGPWGWKDPRTSLTLPYWLRLFPAARVVLVERSSEAVADSLYRRAHEWQAAPAAKLPLGQRLQVVLEDPDALRILLRKLARGKADPLPPDPCVDRDYCRALATRYAEEASRVTAQAVASLVIPYEDLTADPQAVAGRLAAFAGVDVPTEVVARAASQVRPARPPPS